MESNHTELMRPCGLINTLVVFCCTSGFGYVEPHRTHANLGLDTYSCSVLLHKQVRCSSTLPNPLEQHSTT